ASPRRGPIPRPQCGCLARGNRSRRRTAVPEGRRASRRAWRIRRCSEAAPTRDCPTGQRTRGVSREASEKTSPSKCEEGALTTQAVVKNLRDSRTGTGENGQERARGGPRGSERVLRPRVVRPRSLRTHVSTPARLPARPERAVLAMDRY